MNDTTYCYPPDYTVLTNKFGIKDADTLEAIEWLVVRVRMEQGCPSGDFDLNHLKAFLAEPTLGTDAETIPGNQYADHQFGINRGPTIAE